MNEQITYPIRINRYLYLKNICSRRKADELIEKGHIKVNGKKAVLGQKINSGDNVEVDNTVKQIAQNYEYYVFNKPVGVVSHNPQNNEKAVEDFFKNIKYKKLSPVGRLDKDSEGLMLLTNDGRIIDKMLNPKYEHEKEYIVKVDKDLKESFARKMSKGVKIEGYITKPSKCIVIGPRSFRIILTEGKKHQIRRMTVALGYQVKQLKRTRIMNLRLNNLPKGTSRKIDPEEKIGLLKLIGLQ